MKTATDVPKSKPAAAAAAAAENVAAENVAAERAVLLKTRAARRQAA